MHPPRCSAYKVQYLKNTAPKIRKGQRRQKGGRAIPKNGVFARHRGIVFAIRQNAATYSTVKKDYFVLYRIYKGWMKFINNDWNLCVFLGNAYERGG